MENTEQFVGIQVRAQTIDEQDPAAVFDAIQEHVPLNAVVLFAGERLRRGPGHTGGTPFSQPQIGLDEQGRGIMDRLRGPAEERGIGLVMGIGEERWGYWEGCPGYTTIGMVDCFGRTHRQSCVNNPLWQRFQTACIEDAVREHPYLRALMFMHERSGPLSALFYRAGYGDGRVPYCFCEHCCRLGRERGLDPQRAREGYAELYRLARAAEAGEPAPPDGWFLSIWRLLERYPLLTWDQFWWDSLHDYRAALVGAAKAVQREMPVGFHFQHATLTHQFLWRAGDDPARVVEFADWVKPSVYPGCSGSRYRGNLANVHEVLFRDMPKSLAHEFLSWIMGRHPDMVPDPIETEGQAAWPAEWVRDEVSRLVRGCDPLPVYAGLGIGVPGGEETETPELVRGWAEACYEGGASGILLSRHYSEMRPELLAAAGEVIRRHS